VRSAATLAAALLFLGLSAADGLALAAADDPIRRRDTTLPIEITADQLDVEQKAGRATFRGSVNAVQGDMVLRAAVLEVFYRSTDEPAAAALGAISRIEAEGDVFLSTPEETAEGDSGTYDVDKRTVTLAGKVVLTRGANVLRGARLVMDLDSGKSTLFSSGTGGSGRVRGLFVPDKKPERK